MISFRDNLRGIIAMVVGMAGFLLNDTMIKLTAPGMPLGEMIFVRGIFAGLMLGTVCMATGQLRHIRELAQPQVAGRLFGEIGTTLLFLTAVINMPIANATTIVQIVPLSATAFAVLFLRERVGWRRWAAIVVGFLGVVLIVRPGSAGFNAYALVALASVLFATLRDLSTRAMPKAVPTLLLATATSVVMILVGLMLGLAEDWVTPDRWQLMRLVLAGLFLNTAYYFTIVALRSGELAVVMPFRYSIIIWSIISGIIFWGDVPDSLTLTGAFIVIMAGAYTLYRERAEAGARAAAARR